MKEKMNLRSIISGLVVFIVGIFMIYSDDKSASIGLCGSIGCSLIASALVIIMIDLFVDRVKENPLDAWGIKRIYQSRSRMNEDCDISLKKAKYQVDVVAFGLKTYRTEQEKLTLKLLQSGVNFRIITMNPDSPFVSQREKEEGDQEGQIRNSINALVKWSKEMNEKSDRGKIEIRGYSCMTLDFYWRADNDLYIGPYWYGIGSQQTISYRFTEGKAFDTYTDYFDRLWTDETLTIKLS